MKCLITGATGFVGSRLMNKLHSMRLPVRALVRNCSNRALVDKLGVEYVIGDLRDKQSLAKAVAGVETVFHCAGVVTDWAKRSDYDAVNIGGVENILDASHNADVEMVVHLSSCEVYGNPGQDQIKEDFPLVWGQHPYTDSKIRGEEVVRQSMVLGLPAVILRPATIYGPGSEYVFKEMASLIATNRMVLINDGQAVARLTYVDNLVDAILLAAEKEEAIGQTYNVTDGCRTTWKNIYDLIAQLTNNKPPTRSVSFRKALFAATLMEKVARLARFKTRPRFTTMAVRMTGTDQYYSIEKIQKELGFTPQVGFEAGIQALVSWLNQL